MQAPLDQRAGKPIGRQTNKKCKDKQFRAIHVYQPFTIISQCTRYLDAIAVPAFLSRYGTNVLAKTIMSEATSLQSRALSGSAFLWKLFFAAACLATLSLTISIFGRHLGYSLAMGSFSESTKIHRIQVAGNMLLVPENTIRIATERKDDALERLDLYLKWPEMSGYTQSLRDSFTDISNNPSLIYLSIQEQIMSRDMSGRFDPIYRTLIEEPGAPGPAGLTVYNFKNGTGYSGEALFKGDANGDGIFVARCLEDTDMLAACERDILMGDGLSLTYRFPRRLLGQWRAIDLAVANYSRQLFANKPSNRKGRQ